MWVLQLELRLHQAEEMNDLAIIHKAYLVELERKETKEKEEKARDLQRKEAVRVEKVNWNERIDSIEENYHAETGQHSNGCQRCCNLSFAIVSHRSLPNLCITFFL